MAKCPGAISSAHVKAQMKGMDFSHKEHKRGGITQLLHEVVCSIAVRRINKDFDLVKFALESVLERSNFA